MSSIDSSDWMAFAIGGPDGLFDIVKGTRLTKAQMRTGTTPFVGAALMNNGVTALIGNKDHLHPGNVITVAYNGSVGAAFYQPEPFWASDDVNVLYPRFELNEARALFLLPVLRIAGKPYAFEDKWRVEMMEKDQLTLPATATGEPDWPYMERHMKEITASTRSMIASLASLIYA